MNRDLIAPDVSIIIPTRDRIDLLRQAIASIRVESQPFSFEIIVVETGSDGSGEWAQREGCRVVLAQGATFARATNEGVTQARGLVYILMNNDVILDLGSLGKLWHHAMPGKFMAVHGARLRYPTGLIQHAGVGFDQEYNPYPLWRLAPHDHPEVCQTRFLPAVTFALCAIPAGLWPGIREVTGALDEGYQNAYEDIDLCLRVREAGWQVAYHPDVTAVHLEGQTAGRHDHDAESWAHFASKWIATGRISYVTGVWPFRTQRGGAA